MNPLENSVCSFVVVVSAMVFSGDEIGSEVMISCLFYDGTDVIGWGMGIVVVESVWYLFKASVEDDLGFMDLN